MYLNRQVLARGAAAPELICKQGCFPFPQSRTAVVMTTSFLRNQPALNWFVKSTTNRGTLLLSACFIIKRVDTALKTG